MSEQSPIPKIPAPIQPPVVPAPIPPAEVYGVFCAGIDQNTVQKLSNMVALVTQAKPQPKRFHILFQSSGGNISDSVFLYNFFKSCPIEIFVYNGGSIQSGGAIAYLGAKRRIASRLSTFMLHPAHCALQSAPVKKLNNVVSSLTIDDARLNAILKEHLKISDDEWSKIQNHELWLTGEDAIKNGVADEIGEFSPPKGQQLVSLTL